MNKFIFGLFIGVLGTLIIWFTISIINVEPRKCMTQVVHLYDTLDISSAPFIIIGETVICGKDWQLSDVYGPDVERFYGEIKIRDWDSEEFIEEEENDKSRKDN